MLDGAFTCIIMLLLGGGQACENNVRAAGDGIVDPMMIHPVFFQ